jgi:predicted nucleic acid-binding protein
MRTSPRARRGRVFIDTSAYFAITDPRDANHLDAATIMRRLAAAHWDPFTSNFIVAETHALFLTRLSRRTALQFLEAMDRSTTTVVRVTQADERRARAIITQYDDKDFSFTDATSFAIMDRLRIGHAFSADRHFAQYGLTLLTPSAIF